MKKIRLNIGTLLLCLALLTFSVACKAGNSGEKEGVIDTSQTEYTARDGQNGSEIYTPEEYITDETYIEEIPLKQFSFSPEDCRIEPEDNKVLSVWFKDDAGKEHRILCKNVSLSEDGKEWILSEKASMTLVDSIPGMHSIGVDFSESQEFSIFELDSLFSVICADSVEDESKLYSAELTFDIPYEGFTADFQTVPNFFSLKTDEGMSVTVKRFNIKYSGNYTGIRKIFLNSDMYHYYLPGDCYDPSKEGYLSENADWQTEFFDIYAWPDSPLIKSDTVGGMISGIEDYTIGDLHRANGEVKDKSEPLETGDYLDVIIDGQRFALESFVYGFGNYKNAYESRPYSVAPADGILNVLVVPLVFSDQTWTEEDSNILKMSLGTILDENGKSTVFEPTKQDEYSLSEFYNISSLGKLKIQSYVTDVVKYEDLVGYPCSYDDARNIEFGMYDSMCISRYLNENISNSSEFDRDVNGLYDAVIVVNPGDNSGYSEYMMISYGGAYETSISTVDLLAGSKGTEGINYCISMNMGFFFDDLIKGGDEKYTNEVLIHEFGHMLGIWDYYDTSYSGVEQPLGGFDIQDDNRGDHNAYSKFVFGWVEPVVVKPEEIDAKGSLTVTLNSYATTGDFLVIPTTSAKYCEDGSLSPFNEYIMVDFFTPEGLYEKDAALYGLDKTEAVRIYHVDSRAAEVLTYDMSGEKFSLGYVPVTNNYNEDGRYEIELIRAGKKDNGIENVSKNDFFEAGSSFSVEKYRKLFKDGLMDDKSTFPYTINVKSISDGKAVIEICK